jgi:hypothetical protein
MYIIYTPYSYTLSNTHLSINRYFGNIVIPLKEILEIRLFTATDKKGIYGWGFNIYKTNIHRKLHVYIRRQYKNWILIVTPEKKYVIAPDDLRLIHAVKTRLARINPALYQDINDDIDNIIFVSKSTQDISSWIRTSLLIFLPAITSGFFWFYLQLHIIFLILMPLPFLSILVYGIINTPYAYILNKKQLIIKLHTNDIEILLTEIHEIVNVIASDGIVRQKGFFGTFGTHNNTENYKKTEIYTRRDSNWILIVTQRQTQIYTRRNGWTPAAIQKQYVIAPDDMNLIFTMKRQIDINNILESERKIIYYDNVIY